MRWIVHVDMDAYFASVEQAVQPSLRGKPVIVGGRPGSRGVVTTASYEARPFGVRAGMPIGEAVRRCPRAVFLPGNYALYTHTSKRIFDVLRRFTPRVEPASVDEAYLEIETETDPLVLGARIQSEIDRDIGLGASLGISESTYVAKVASSFAKPRGLTLLPVAEVAARLWPLPVATLYGVGPKTEARLHALGLRTIAAVATADPALLERKLGMWGPALRRHARGESRGRVLPPDEAPDAKSIGNERTLERDERDPDKLEALVATLAEKVGCRAR